MSYDRLPTSSPQATPDGNIAVLSQVPLDRYEHRFGVPSVREITGRRTPDPAALW